MQSGFLLLNKKVGLTSQQALSQLKRKFGIKKIGHHGTLDPFATGLLLVGIGEATKFFQYIDDAEKTYQATLRLGVATDTLDRTGKVTGECQVPELSVQQVDDVLATFLGSQKQKPPMYSAVKMGGEKLYEKARRGEQVERAEREIIIHGIKLLELNATTLAFEATVSRGTYIRVLAEDVAAKLKTCGHLTQLNRTRLCGFGLEKSWDGESGQLTDHLLPIQALLSGYPRYDASHDEVIKLGHGQRIIGTFPEAQRETLLYFRENFVGMCRVESGVLMPLRLTGHS